MADYQCHDIDGVQLIKERWLGDSHVPGGDRDVWIGCFICNPDGVKLVVKKWMLPAATTQLQPEDLTAFVSRNLDNIHQPSIRVQSPAFQQKAIDWFNAINFVSDCKI